MKLKNKLFAVTLALTLIVALLVTGCTPAEDLASALALPTGAQQAELAAEGGVLVLSVNPEIGVEYDRDGLVTGVTGRNDDGRKVVAGYNDYIGKPCNDVVQELIVKINEAGYFVEEVEGENRRIVIEIEPGSALPQQDFLQSIAANTQETVRGLNLSSNVAAHDDSALPAAQPGYLSPVEARKAALEQAGVNASDVTFEEREFDYDDGRAVYEVEFSANGVRYDYEIDAKTGKILKEEQKVSIGDDGNVSIDDRYHDTDYGPYNDGVTDYDDTDYGPNNDGVTDYDDTDYGPNNDGVTDYDDTDYGPYNDGVTDYSYTDYGDSAWGDDTDYDDTDYDDTDYDDTDYD